MHLYLWVSGNGSKGFSEMVMIVLEWTSKREYIFIRRLMIHVKLSFEWQAVINSYKYNSAL